MRLALLPILLAACSAPAIVPTQTFRDPSALLSSKADHDPARLAGRWHEVARFPDGVCAGGTVDYAVSSGGALAATESCGGGTVTRSVEPDGPGRMRIVRGETRRVEWVLWMDTGARTVVLVQPDGSGGRILDRARTLPPDRRRAAETVLDFNGFDPRRLAYGD